MRFFKVLKITEDLLSGLFFLVGIIISIYGIVMRYLGQSQYWTSELYTMLIVWAIFIGFGSALRDDAHISLDIVYERLGEKAQRVVNLIGILVGILFSIFFIKSGMDMLIASYSQGVKTLDLEWPIWISYLIMPIGGLLFFLHFIEKGILHFSTLKTDK